MILLITTETVRSLHPALASQLLRQASTNLTEMGRSAGRVLFLSTFLIDDGRWITQAALFTVIYVPLERWAGSWRWLAVVVAGHVGATLVTTIGIWADVRSNRGAIQLTHAIDVGVSYGLYAAAGLLTFGLGRSWLRVGLRLVLVVAVTSPLARSQTFTEAGHIAALCIGTAMFLILGPGLQKRPLLWPVPNVTEPAATPVRTT